MWWEQLTTVAENRKLGGAKAAENWEENLKEGTAWCQLHCT